MNKKYHVKLNDSERERVQGMMNNAKTSKTYRKRCSILLMLDENAGKPSTQEEIAVRAGVSDVTVYNTLRDYAENGLEQSLKYQKPKEPPIKPIVTGEAEARIVALACGSPPSGYNRWTVRLLTERVIELEIMESVSRETIRTTLKKLNSDLI